VKLDVSMLTHNLKTTPEYARKVEAMGYDCLWSSETQHNPYLPLAIAATTTSRIKLGTNIATVFSRSPMITAHIAWDLAKASGGRFILGLGTQVKAHNERRFSVKFESPGPKWRKPSAPSGPSGAAGRTGLLSTSRDSSTPSTL
jgi:alkanesulfonate monooxygenase SsuD/methylene tetrahydromethanopterin reductase-like flavin-dependent oxidoreductase (luciferase family)